MTVESCFYEGTVRHRRFRPIERSFEHRLFLTHLRLDELHRLDDLGPAVASDRRRPVWFDRRVHLGDPAEALDSSVRDLVAQRLGRRPGGPVSLLAHLRTAGACFNPLAVYYCHDAANRVETVVLQVTNTPWREQHAYVVDVAGRPDPWEAEFDKELHVSPFLPLDLVHRYRGGPPAASLHVGIDDHDRAGAAVLSADLVLRRRPFSRRELARLSLRHPLLTWRVSAAIHAQALRLAARRVPFHRHPDRSAR